MNVLEHFATHPIQRDAVVCGTCAASRAVTAWIDAPHLNICPRLLEVGHGRFGADLPDTSSLWMAEISVVVAIVIQHRKEAEIGCMTFGDKN